MSDVSDWDALMRMTRDQLHACAIDYYKQASATAPDVAKIKRGTAVVLFKDYGRRSGWFARWIAPILIRREASALSVLTGLDGVPRLVRSVDSRGLLIEHCPARPWAENHPGDRAYERLAHLIQAMHDKGIAHGDLRGGGNILVDDDDRPYLVDFVSRIRRGKTWNTPWNWVFRQFVAADWSALSKLTIRHARHLAGPTDYERCRPTTPLARWARLAGASIRQGIRFFSRTR